MRAKSEITMSEARKIAAEAAASIIGGTLGEGFSAGLNYGHDPDSVEGRRIDRALNDIVGQLEDRAASPPRRSLRRPVR